MRAIILAGGKGRRLAPYTVTFPKPLVPVSDMPILEIVVKQLKNSGFNHITLAVGHLAELLMTYFKDGSKWGVKIDYSMEERPLGTAGPLLQIEDLPETFIVMNGDVLTTLKYYDLYRCHQQADSALTIACHRCNAKIDLGVIEFDGRMQVTAYREKPGIPYDVSMGIYVFDRSVLELITPNAYFDFPDLVHKMLAEKRTVKVYLSDNEWLDIGRPSDYEIATRRFEEIREQFLLSKPDLQEVLDAAE